MAHETYDSFWQARNTRPHLKAIRPSVLTVGGWFDTEDLYGPLHLYQAIEKNNPGIKSVVVESVPEGPDAERVMETAIRNGAKVIYANSFGYMDHVINMAKKYPDVYFNHCSGYKVAPNVSTYFGRMYQPRYLSGLVAGAATKSNIIGYVAA